MGGLISDDPPLNQVQEGIQREKEKIRKGMPLKITITRDINDEIENLLLDEVTDKDGNSLNKSFFNLQVQSMSEVENFWLDSGIFSLSINSSHN